MSFSKPFDEAITVKMYFYLSTVSFLAHAVFMKRATSCIVCHHKAWLKSSFREIWFLALPNGCSQMVTAQQHGWNGLDGEKRIFFFFFFLSICCSCLFVSWCVSFDFWPANHWTSCSKTLNRGTATCQGWMDSAKSRIGESGVSWATPCI